MLLGVASKVLTVVLPALTDRHDGLTQRPRCRRLPPRLPSLALPACDFSQPALFLPLSVPLDFVLTIWSRLYWHFLVVFTGVCVCAGGALPSRHMNDNLAAHLPSGDGGEGVPLWTRTHGEGGGALGHERGTLAGGREEDGDIPL